MMEIFNRQAKHNYFIEDTYECGIELRGCEVKSIRAGKCNLKDSYAIIRSGEIFLLNVYVAPYKEGSIFNESETRSRKLLLHKSEIRKLNDDIRLKGLTLVPLKLYFVKDKVKIELGVCRGKKNYDKRESIKEKDLQRQARKDFKYKY
ncbi:MAG: SsrA-binding protein SmpB [Bacilli bacterium]|nr:SsrA-binding protein SmpB [Bacilli bacterium]